MRALLVDLDDTLLDYSGGVEDCWTAACAACCTTGTVDASVLVRAIAEARLWFWRDPERQRRERVQMRRAWQRIVELSPRFGKYQEGTDRVLPVIRLIDAPASPS